MSIQPQGEDLRKAVKWIAEERKNDPAANIKTLVNKACTMFDLSPLDAEFLARFVVEEKL